MCIFAYENEDKMNLALLSEKSDTIIYITKSIKTNHVKFKVIKQADCSEERDA